MFDAPHLRAQLSGALARGKTCKPASFDWLMALSLILIIVAGSSAFYTIAHRLLPMTADDYQRLDSAIVSMTNGRQMDANQMWQKIFLKLRINNVSELKMNHVDDVSEIILDEIGKGDSLK